MSYYTHNLDPIAFEIFNTPFSYYWLVYFLGVPWFLFIAKHLVKTGHASLNFDDIVDYSIFGYISVFFGARFFYILIYNLDFYLRYPSEIYKFWHGGMSFHGAIFGLTISSIIIAKLKRQSFYQFTDLLCLALPFLLGLGRIANFINGELIGRKTDIAWAVIFPQIDSFPRHPSQLYEAIFEGFLIFGLLYMKRRYLKRPGVLSTFFLILYGSFRFIIEFFRRPDPQLGLYGDYTMGQILCLIMIFVGLGLHLSLKKQSTSAQT